VAIGKLYDHDPRHWQFTRRLDDHTGLVDPVPSRTHRWLRLAGLLLVLLACLTLISE